MKLVTNTVPVIINNMYPLQNNDGSKSDWSKVKMAGVGTVFKIRAVMMQQVFLENSNHSVQIDVNIFKEFFIEHEVEV